MQCVDGFAGLLHTYMCRAIVERVNGDSRCTHATHMACLANGGVEGWRRGSTHPHTHIHSVHTDTVHTGHTMEWCVGQFSSSGLLVKTSSQWPWGLGMPNFPLLRAWSFVSSVSGIGSGGVAACLAKQTYGVHSTVLESSFVLYFAQCGIHTGTNTILCRGIYAGGSFFMIGYVVQTESKQE